MSKEYINTDNVCPACGQPYGEHNIHTDNKIKCSYCSYEKLLRTPLQKKRENIVIKNHVEYMINYMNISLAAFMIMFLPLILYVLLGPKNFVEIWAEHPVGSIIYIVAVIWIYILAPPVIFSLRHKYAKIRKHGYSMEWIRSLYAKGGKGKRKTIIFAKLDSWEAEIRKHKDAIG